MTIALVPVSVLALWRIAVRPAGFAPWPPLWTLLSALAIGVGLAIALAPAAGAALGVPLAALLIGCVTDRERGVLLDGVAAGGVITGIALAVLAGETERALLGAAVPLVTFGAINAVAGWATPSVMFGWGDVKAAPLVGLVLGPSMGLVAVGLALGACAVVILVRRRPGVAGPYLAVVTVAMLLAEQVVGGSVLGSI